MKVIGLFLIVMFCGCGLINKMNPNERFIYDPNWIETDKVKRVDVVDVNKNGLNDRGDKVILYIDRNRDGKEDYVSYHWYFGTTVKGGLLLTKMPIKAFPDVDGDRILDYFLSNFDENGIPQNVVKLDARERRYLHGTQNFR